MIDDKLKKDHVIQICVLKHLVHDIMFILGKIYMTFS